ncbi:hypothetical protein Bca4012_057659 [Brassica carinata]
MALAGDELENTLPPGKSTVRCSSVGWKSARLIIFVEMAEQFAYYGISSNLITYLTGPLGESTQQLRQISIHGVEWYRFCNSTGASSLTRFSAVSVPSSLHLYYISWDLGYCLFSAMILYESKDSNQLQVILFFVSLYLIALGQGGYTPCLKVFGADQFVGNDLEKSKAKSASMLLALLLFLLGTKTYQDNKIYIYDIANPNETLPLLARQGSKQFRFLDKAAISCDLAEIEEAKALLKLVPIWMNCLVLTGASSCSGTEDRHVQGSTMNRLISPGLLVPAATLQFVTSLTVIVFIPIYDRLLVPVARSFTQNHLGITMLQRIGTGIFFSILAMVITALVETKRLQAAQDDVMMSVWWLAPQYAIYGISYVFTLIGLHEFFYDQVPRELRSIGMALNTSIYGVGHFVSSFMISVIDKVTSQSCQTSWSDNDLNKAHLDDFYWLLAFISSISFASYLWCAKSYVYNSRVLKNIA